MPNHLVTLAGVRAASFAWLDNTLYPTWLAAQGGYPGGGVNRMYRHLVRNAPGGQNGNDRIAAITDEAETTMRQFLTHYATNHLNWAAPAGTIRNIIGRTRYNTIAAIAALRGRTAAATTVYCNNAANRTQIENQTLTWARSAREGLIEYWLDQIIAPANPFPALAPVNDANVAGAGGVACAVHYRQAGGWHQLGGMTVAVPRATCPNHAEAQWFTAHGAALAALLAAGTAQRVDFHISEQPCGQCCAQLVITRWAAYATAVPAYVITYADTDGRANRYRILDNAIIRLT
jgi:hypothetical protein